jgi:hypothetical protein
MGLKVKIHTWIEGELKVIWHFFEEIGEALGFAEDVEDAHSVKVYDDNHQLVHSVKNIKSSGPGSNSSDSTETYA